MQANDYMRELHMSNMVRKYCNATSAEKKAAMEEKVLTEKIFKGKKSSYSARVGVPFNHYRAGKAALCCRVLSKLILSVMT